MADIICGTFPALYAKSKASLSDATIYEQGLTIGKTRPPDERIAFPLKHAETGTLVPFCGELCNGGFVRLVFESGKSANGPASSVWSRERPVYFKTTGHRIGCQALSVGADCWIPRSRCPPSRATRRLGERADPHPRLSRFRLAVCLAPFAFRQWRHLL